MKIKRVRIEPISYALRNPIETHRGPLGDREGFRVRLYEASGAVGVGEALPLPAFGTEEIAQTREQLEALRLAFPGSSGKLPALLDRADETLVRTPAARCAVDTALHDLAARGAGVPISRLLGPAAATVVAVNAVLGARTLEETVTEAREAVRRGYTTLKLKVGRGEPAADLERIAAVRSALGPEPRLRLDANGAWRAEVALAFLCGAEELDLELIEQPVPPEDLEALENVAAGSSIPVAVDETLADPRLRAAVLERRLGSVVILKPMVLGGLRESARLAHAARERGFRVVVTTTFEGTVGTAAALHLAAAVGDVRLASGLASADVIVATFPYGLIPREGKLRCPTGAGLGFEAGTESER